MVSAVFHRPREAGTASGAVSAGRPRLVPVIATATSAPATATSEPAAAAPRPEAYDWRAALGKVLPPLLGMALLIAVWELLTLKSTTFPSPAATFTEAIQLFSDPFYRKGPNDQGIGWNILFSLERVAIGFGLAALVGIPLGFLIGRFELLNRMVSPLISLLRPVSPLAWLPIGLLVFKAANPASGDTGRSRLISGETMRLRTVKRPIMKPIGMPTSAAMPKPTATRSSENRMFDLAPEKRIPC